MIAAPVENYNPGHLGGFFLLAVGQILARIMTFLSVAYLTRALGVEVFGVVGFGAAAAAYFMLIVDAGLDLVGMRHLAKPGSDVDAIVSSILTSRMALAVLATAFLGVAAPWLVPSPTALAVLIAYSLTFLSFASNLKWGFQGLGQNALVASALVLSQACYLAGVVRYVHGPTDAVKVPVLLFGSELIGAGLLFVRYRRQGFTLRLRHARDLSWSLLREAMPLAGVRAVRALTVNFDLLLLGLIDSPVAVGVYAAVSRIILVLRELGELYYAPMFPGLTRAAHETGDRHVALARVGLRYAAVIIFPIAVGGCLTGSEFLSFVFGLGYRSGSPALCLLLAAMAFAIPTGTYRYSLVACGRQRTLFAIMAAAAVLNVGMNVLLIPRYSIIGAAISALAAEIVVFSLAWAAVAELASLSPWRTVLRPAIAVAGMALTLELLPARPFLVTVAVGAATYVALAFLVGAVRPRELLEATRGVSPSWPGPSLRPGRPPTGRAC